MFSDEEIEKHTKYLQVYQYCDNSEFMETFPVIIIVASLIIIGILFPLWGTPLVPIPWIIPSSVIAFIVIVLISLLISYKLNLIGGSKPSPYYELENSSREHTE